MNFLINETNKPRTLHLYYTEHGENATADFFQQTVGLDACGVQAIDEKTGLALTWRLINQADYNELHAIIEVAQSNINMRQNFENRGSNPISYVIKRDVQAIFDNHLNKEHDRIFALKNAVDAEHLAWRRIMGGQVAASSGENPIVFTHYRGGCNEQDWIMQMTGDFMMVMPQAQESYCFTAQVEFQYVEREGEVKLVNYELECPPAFTYEQMQEVLRSFCQHARERVSKETNLHVQTIDEENTEAEE